MDRTLDVLGASLLALGARLETIAANVANAETPGYRRRDVLFEGLVEEALRRGEDLPAPRVVVDPWPVGAKGNGVDLVSEMAELARTNLRYELVARLARAHVGLVRAAMGGRTA